MLSRYFERIPRVILAGFLIAAVAFVDWRVEANIAFGFLYLFPLLIVGTVLPRLQILLVAALCTFLSDYFDPFPFTFALSLPQDILVFTSLTGAGLFSYEVTRSKRREMENMQRVAREAAARREAEEQLAFLVETSPAAILTMSADWQILHANSASHRLLGGAAGGLLGRDIRSYIPALGTVPTIGETRQTFRTEMQCPAKREEGEIFLANVYFSTYNTAKGPRMAALVVDASEELRQREELSLEQLMAGSRILVGAVSHEIRNVCSTINVVYENLVRGSRLNGNQDFEALGSLVEILNKVASLELKQSSSSSQVNDVDLREVLDKLRIVLDSYCQEANILLEWNVPDVLPRVLADSDRLLQVLLNLAKNSERALKDATIKKLKISVSMSGYGASIRVSDTGPGIRSTENLFQPFQRGADSTGLGLYLSRAFLRSFNGDLHHDPEMPGCSFVIDLAISEASPK